MKAAMLLLLATAALAVVVLAGPSVKVVTDEMTVTSTGNVTVHVGTPQSVVAATPGVPVVSGPGWKPPAWLGSPLARGALYSAASIAAVFLLQWIKRRYGWEGKRMLTVTIGVVAVFGLILMYLFQDKGATLLSNVWLLGGGGGFIFMLANLIYQWKFKRS